MEAIIQIIFFLAAVGFYIYRAMNKSAAQNKSTPPVLSGELSEALRRLEKKVNQPQSSLPETSPGTGPQRGLETRVRDIARPQRKTGQEDIDDTFRHPQEPDADSFKKKKGKLRDGTYHSRFEGESHATAEAAVDIEEVIRQEHARKAADPHKDAYGARKASVNRLEALKDKYTITQLAVILPSVMEPWEKQEDRLF